MEMQIIEANYFGVQGKGKLYINDTSINYKTLRITKKNLKDFEVQYNVHN